jgi:hypothetical protein
MKSFLLVIAGIVIGALATVVLGVTGVTKFATSSDVNLSIDVSASDIERMAEEARSPTEGGIMLSEEGTAFRCSSNSNQNCQVEYVLLNRKDVAASSK